MKPTDKYFMLNVLVANTWSLKASEVGYLARLLYLKGNELLQPTDDPVALARQLCVPPGSEQKSVTPDEDAIVFAKKHLRDGHLPVLDVLTSDGKSGPDLLSSAERDFLTFWDEYPRKAARVQAMRAFMAARKHVSLETLLLAVRNAKMTRQWQKNGGEFIPYASTFLNSRLWEDFLPQAPGAGAPKSATQQTIFGRTIVIGGRRYGEMLGPERKDFQSDEEYQKARDEWEVWRARL